MIWEIVTLVSFNSLLVFERYDLIHVVDIGNHLSVDYPNFIKVYCF